jgi:hypothetical protein
MAASVANFKALTLLTVGSRTPCLKLCLTSPLNKSNPLNLYPFSSTYNYYDLLCNTLSLLIKSIESLAALVANVLGIIVNASANSATAIYSFDSNDLE